MNCVSSKIWVRLLLTLSHLALKDPSTNSLLDFRAVECIRDSDEFRDGFQS